MIRFFTNLDEAQPYVHLMNDRRLGEGWKAPNPPRVGDSVRFVVSEHARTHFDLRVVAVTHSANGEHVDVELHVPTYFSTIKEWMEHFARLRERA